ncbi:MAG: protein translocase subunit SecD [Ruminococcaceae bacterium]|nr:protein translocase subunit SecD [Oscillospiraceae bacterium]
MSKETSRLIFAITLIATLVTIAVCGLPYLGLPGVFEKDAIRKGLDLSGGSLIVYEAQIEGDMPDDLEEKMDAVVVMMRNRLTTLGYTEAVVTKIGDTKVQIEIPNITNPEEAVQKLGSTAKLEFRDYEGTVILTGEDIAGANAVYGQYDDSGVAGYFVSLQLSEAAVEKFGEATDRVKDYASEGNNYIAIYLDDELQTSPSVTQKLNTSELSITKADYTAEEVKWLASVISAGALPFALKDIQLESIGPELGENALETSFLAAVIGLALVIIFMCVVYKMFGIISALSLAAYTAIVCIVIVLFKVNLSLPGIAGIVLSIGMAVDANVVIFERIREEIRLGKSLAAATKAGFNRAFAAVIDSNITTLIAAIVLWVFGTGFITGFAITLFIGVAVSLFTAIVLTRFILNAIVRTKFADSKLFNI